MLTAPALDYDSDESSVVSVEETEEERRQRKLKKKQLARREKDKKILRQQSERRKKREQELLNHLKASKEAEERERKARWGVVDEDETAKREEAPRLQDLPDNLAATKHPALWAPMPRYQVGENERRDMSYKSPIVFGYRAGYEPAAQKWTLPRRTKLKDPMLLERACVVCGWNVAGCAGCWTPNAPIRTYKKYGTDVKFDREGDKDESHGQAGTFSSKVVTHTKMRDMASIEYQRRFMAFMDVYVKTLPSGAIVKLRMESNDTIGYLFHQFRNHSPMVGYDQRMYMVFPSEAGLVMASPEHWHGTEANRGYHYNKYKLSDYKLTKPNVQAAFLHVSKLNDATTPKLVQAFYRSNFTLSRPWLTRLLRHLAFLPDDMPGDDEAQSRVSKWCAESQEEIRKWEEYDKQLEKEQRAEGDEAEEAVRKTTEIDGARERNRRWRRARRRDARRLLALAAEAAKKEEERLAQERAAQEAADRKAAAKAAALEKAKRERELRRAGPKARREALKAAGAL